MKKKDLNLVYIALAGLGIYYIYNYYQKKKSTVVQNSTPVILNQSTLLSPEEQVAFKPVPDDQKPVYNIKFVIPQTL